jgi:hypothetical protein
MLDQEILRNRITRIIASTRFPFVDQENWSPELQTIVNDENKRYAIYTKIGVMYPSIVIANADGSIRELGTVESEADITSDSVPRWRAYSDVAPYGREFKKFFLYVPDGKEAKTKKLLVDNKINYDGIRIYRIENQALKIIPYITLNDEYDHMVT